MSLLSVFPNGWQHYLLGGLLIGAAVFWLYLSTGRVGGMSSVFSSSWSFIVKSRFFQQNNLTQTRSWRLIYALGLVIGAWLWWYFIHDGGALSTQVPRWLLLLGGIIAGFGARLGDGCTSGHGICGLGSLQLPSLWAVLTFMATGFLTANLVTRFLV